MGVLFTDRLGGRSAAPFASLNLALHVGDDPVVVAENRWRVAVTAGLDPDRVVFMDQVHGSEVAVVRAAGVVTGVDALVTDQPGLALAVLAADCVPVVLADGRAGLVGVAHSGRTGTALAVVAATVGVLRDLGATGLAAELGPAVCGACYEVPTALQQQVAAVVPAAVSTTREGTSGLDLRAGIRAQLEDLGVPEVTVSARCTLEDPELFSHRRDGTTGRQAGYVWLT